MRGLGGGSDFPVEILEDQYLAPFGGWSKELAADQVGLNEELMLSNTDLVPFEDKVTIRKFEAKALEPLFYRRWFHVVPLNEEKQDAFSKSLSGEAVLPACCANRAEMRDLTKDSYVVLNSVLSKKISGDPTGWDALIVRRLQSPTFGLKR